MIQFCVCIVDSDLYLYVDYELYTFDGDSIDSDSIFHPFTIFRESNGKEYYRIYLDATNNQYDKNFVVLGVGDYEYDDNFIEELQLIVIDRDNWDHDNNRLTSKLTANYNRYTVKSRV